MEEEFEGQGSSEENVVVPDENSQVVDSPVETEESKVNPAWGELLDIIPEMLHSQATPLLKQWDTNYQNGINKVHSQYEAYKPYVEREISPDQINYALNIMQAIETNPEEVVKVLQGVLGVSQSEAEKIVAEEQEQGQVETEIPDELFNHPKFQQMEQLVQTMAQQLVQKQESEEESAADAALTTELTSLATQHGEFDVEFVLTKATMNPSRSLEDHVKDYHEFVNKLTPAPRNPGPKILGVGGQAPNNQITKENLNDPKTRKGLVAEMLKDAGMQ